MIKPPPTEVELRDRPKLFAWVQWLDQAYRILFNAQTYGVTQIVSPTSTGSSYSIDQNTGTFILDESADYGTGAVTLPAQPSIQRQVSITSTHVVTAFTITDPAGYTIKNNPTTLAAGQTVSFIFNSANTTWYRTQ